MTFVATFLLAFVMLLLVIGGMAIGVISGRKPISGSCGGLANGGCELCSEPCHEPCHEPCIEESRE